MNLLLAITYDEFQTVTLGWIAGGTLIILALITAALKIIPEVAKLKASLEALTKQSDRHAEEIKVNTQTITQVALNTPTTVTDTAGIQQINQKLDEIKAEQTNPGGK